MVLRLFDDLADIVYRGTFTFIVPREVRIVHFKAGVLVWILRLAIIFYVLWSMWVQFLFIEYTTPIVVVDGWGEDNTLYTASGQTWTDANGVTQPVNAFDPHYCGAPYTNDYSFSKTSTYDNIKCLGLIGKEMWTKTLPAYITYKSFIRDVSHLRVPCQSMDVRCNATSPEVMLEHGMCICSSTRHFYTLNPEGMVRSTFCFESLRLRWSHYTCRPLMLPPMHTGECNAILMASTDPKRGVCVEIERENV